MTVQEQLALKLEGLGAGRGGLDHCRFRTKQNRNTEAGRGKLKEEEVIPGKAWLFSNSRPHLSRHKSAVVKEQGTIMAQ